MNSFLRHYQQPSFLGLSPGSQDQSLTVRMRNISFPRKLAKIPGGSATAGHSIPDANQQLTMTWSFTACEAALSEFCTTDTYVWACRYQLGDSLHVPHPQEKLPFSLL